MIILVQPMYSKQELNADSNYVVYTSLIRGMLEVRPDWHFVVIFPDVKSGFKYEEDGFFRLPNVTRVAQRISPRKFSNAVSYDGSWYDKLYRTIGFDVAWCNLVEIAGHLAIAGEGTFEQKGRPIVVASHNYVIHETLPYPFDRMANVAMAQVAGAWLADWNVFNSDWCRQMFTDTASIWLKADVIGEVLSRSSRIDYGTLRDDIQPVQHDNDIPIIGYNHRLQGYKNWRQTFEILEQLHNEGLEFRVLHMNNTAEHLAYIQHFPFVDVKLSATHDEYMQALVHCDLNVTNSSHETFCIAAIEAMAYGQPLVAPQAITFPEITGQLTNDYPYLFRSIEEQMQFLRVLLNDQNERRKWGAILSEHVRSHYTRKPWASQYAALFERLTDFDLGTPDDAKDAARSLLEKGRRLEIQKYYRQLTKSQVNGRNPFSNQSFPLPKVVRLVRELGGRVTIERGQQIVYST